MNLETEIDYQVLRYLVRCQYVHSEQYENQRNLFTRNAEGDIYERIPEFFDQTISRLKGLASRFILLIGGDSYLLDAVGSYIYCTKGVNEFYYRPFMGRDEKHLEEVLNENVYFNRMVSSSRCDVISGHLINHVRLGASVFLGDLKYPNSLYLERMAGQVAGIKNEWSR